MFAVETWVRLGVVLLNWAEYRIYLSRVCLAYGDKNKGSLGDHTINHEYWKHHREDRAESKTKVALISFYIARRVPHEKFRLRPARLWQFLCTLFVTDYDKRFFICKDRLAFTHRKGRVKWFSQKCWWWHADCASRVVHIVASTPNSPRVVILGVWVVNYICFFHIQTE